ncbi:MAG: HIT family protein [Pigmentiphaga sp.]
MNILDTYDPNNIFARILRGEAPCHEVFQDGNTLAFLDAFPQAPGHTLVIPKTPTRSILDIDRATLCATMWVVKRVAGAVLKATGCDGIHIVQNNGGVGGQSVPHFHVHVLPRKPGQPLALHAQTPGKREELEHFRALIAAAIIEAELD